MPDGISNGKEIDAIVERYKREQHIHFARGSSLTGNLLFMVVNNHIDYTITYSWMVTYFCRETGLSDRLISLRLKESRSPIIHYAACPRNPWGAARIREINQILARIRSEKNIVIPWKAGCRKNHFQNTAISMIRYF